MTDPELAPQDPSRKPAPHRMPEGSPFYERIVPLLLVGMGILTAALVLFALGVLLGIVPFQ